MVLISKEESIKAMKKAGISKSEMKKTMDTIRSSTAMSVVPPGEVEDTVTQLAAKLLGVNVGEKALRNAVADSDCVKTTIQKVVHKEVREVKVCLSGFIKSIEEDVTRSDAPKLNVRVTNASGTSTIKCAVFDDCLELFESIEFKELDKIKIINADIYEFDYKGYKGAILTCGRYTTVKKVKGNFTQKLPAFIKADMDNTTFVTGIVSETDQHSYFGCPECKKKYADKADDLCDHCDHEGDPIEYKIITLAVTQGNLEVVVTIFGSKDNAKDLFGKMVTVVGRKKGSRELTANNIRVEGLGLNLKPHGKHFAADEDDEDDDDTETKPKKKKEHTQKAIQETSFADKVFYNTVIDMVNIYDKDGIKIKDLIVGIKARFSSMSKSEVREKIEEMSEHNKIKIKNKTVYSI